MTKFTTVAQIEAAETKDLIVFYNSLNADKPVKKFADRATALKRCIALLAIDDEEAAKIVAAEEEQVAKKNEEVKSEADKNFVWPFPAAGEIGAATTDPKADDEGGAKSKKNTSAPKPKANTWSNSASNSAGVAASWADPSVAAARLTRDGVAVTFGKETTTYKSTRDAFRAFRLMDSKHIRFRGILKAAGKATYTENGKEYHFAII